ncbi:trypsin-1-like isoform X2 [Thrips palmi]|uniref:Trypsin-1-like isoform X2 n=1 Tax=Thrips palmi TaxID=161013 RepID=A0A6P8ZX97_THRPL|nr:trypsin-1-like isoform X2 [Thrips palmi]
MRRREGRAWCAPGPEAKPVLFLLPFLGALVVGHVLDNGPTHAATRTATHAAATHAHHAVNTSPALPPLGMRIVNGDSVDIVDYPFQASIEMRGHHICGAAIIAKNWVVSAKHCFSAPGAADASAYRVRVGSTQRQYGGSLHPVDRIVMYPSDAIVDYDVAVLHVAAPFTYGQTVSSIELAAPSDAVPPAKRKVQVTGYGAIAEAPNSRLSPRLLKADLTTVEHKDCRDFFKEGDSGGPLSENLSGSWKLVGIVSFGLGCGRKGHPGIYANIANHDIRNFIKSVTNV